nr:PREDICTED: jmjC domain-containing histone demethylation protein 1 isoform X1 [Bemisia tabaci]
MRVWISAVVVECRVRRREGRPADARGRHNLGPGARRQCRLGGFAGELQCAFGPSAAIANERARPREMASFVEKRRKKCRVVPIHDCISRPAMRDRKEKKLYTDDWALGDDDIEGRRSFSIQEKLETDRYSQNFVKEMQGADFNLAYLQRHGFNTPLLFKEKAGLHLQVPSSTFTVKDVRTCVGSRRTLDVMDVNTQKNCEMTMKEWQRYYDDPVKDKLLNVISLEFSHTKLENYVKSPAIVRQIDWVDCVWPRHLKEAQTESTNVLEDMMYPKVQKYCLMSVKGCYTDFHIDFGGTSVWYHILRGRKVFWLIPPTEHNIQLYEQWVLSGKQGDIFFGDTVEKCGRVTLIEGCTFFIPTGWIHAVYTPKDSLVFGGNFLHSYAIEKQLRIAQVEDSTRVPQKFRYPFFTEMLWYVLERYVSCLLGVSHLAEKDSAVQPSPRSSEHTHLTHQELHGLKSIVTYLHCLPANKKNVPELIKDPVALIKDVRTLVEQHRHDSSESAVTGKPVLKSQFEKDSIRRAPLSKTYQFSPGPDRGHGHPNGKSKIPRGSGNGPRRRRTRCKKCQACKQADCGECIFCQDMVKFGGPGRAKQTCVMRQCLQPMLPITAACVSCSLDGWGQQLVIPIQKTNKETPSSLMECSVCYEIIHPDCAAKVCADSEGIVNEDLPNSWECPKCCKDGKNVEYKPRHFRARQKSTDMRKMHSDGSPIMKRERMEDHSGGEDSDSSDSDRTYQDHPAAKRIKSESPEDLQNSSGMKWLNGDSVRSRNSDETTSNNSGANITASSSSSSTTCEPRKLALRTQLAYQLNANSNKPLRRPLYVVRPSPAPSTPTIKQEPGVNSGNANMNRTCLLAIFKYLSPTDLSICAQVCRTWSQISVDPVLWKTMNLQSKKLTSSCLTGIVRRQPETLNLDWTNVVKRQLTWLITRLPQMRHLSLQGCPVVSVTALRTCQCPPLQSLDLSFVTGMNDAALREILSSPSDSRPGLIDTKSRLRNLKVLKLAGCNVTDVAILYIVQNICNLSVLDLSQCNRLTDAGISQLSSQQSLTLKSLQTLNLAGCKLITDQSLDHLVRCVNLSRLDLRHAPLITYSAVQKFISHSKQKLSIFDSKLIKLSK